MESLDIEGSLGVEESHDIEDSLGVEESLDIKDSLGLDESRGVESAGRLTQSAEHCDQAQGRPWGGDGNSPAERRGIFRQ